MKLRLVGDWRRLTGLELSVRPGVTSSSSGGGRWRAIPTRFSSWPSRPMGKHFCHVAATGWRSSGTWRRLKNYSRDGGRSQRAGRSFSSLQTAELWLAGRGANTRFRYTCFQRRCLRKLIPRRPRERVEKLSKGPWPAHALGLRANVVDFLFLKSFLLRQFNPGQLPCAGRSSPCHGPILPHSSLAATDACIAKAACGRC